MFRQSLNLALSNKTIKFFFEIHREINYDYLLNRAN